MGAGAVITVVCWFWQQPGVNRDFGPQHVNALMAKGGMVDRHCSLPHRRICVTDNPSGIRCETFPLWNDHAGIPNPNGPRLPRCHRRLKLFDHDTQRKIGIADGDVVVSVDLDATVTGNLDHLWSRPETFVGWRRPGSINPCVLNGSMFLLRAGEHQEVWERFDPVVSPIVAAQAGYLGSDQAWLSYCMGEACPVWTDKDGVIYFGKDMSRYSGRPPDHASIVFFPGSRKPWHRDVISRHAWVREHYPFEFLQVAA
jgi:hypothetical protein